MGRVSKPAQRIVVLILALVLMLPVGIFGISELMGPSESEQAAQQDDEAQERRTVDPSTQPARPQLESPEEPAAVREQTPAGAEAAFTHTLETYPYMMSSGDTEPWRESVEQSCQVCVTFIENAAMLHAQDGYLVGGEFTVESATFTPAEDAGDPPGSGTVVATFSQEAGTLVDDPNLEALQMEALSGSLQADVAWDGERWKITDMAIAPEEPGAAGGGAPSDAGGEG